MGSAPPSGPLVVLSPGHVGTLCWTLWGCSRGAKIGQRLLGQGSDQALKNPPNCLKIRSTWGHLHSPHSPVPGQNCLGLDPSAHRPAQPEGASARFVSEEHDTGEDGCPSPWCSLYCPKERRCWVFRLKTHQFWAQSSGDPCGVRSGVFVHR